MMDNTSFDLYGYLAYLFHSGVKGMRWGVRNDDDDGGDSSSSDKGHAHAGLLKAVGLDSIADADLDLVVEQMRLETKMSDVNGSKLGTTTVPGRTANLSKASAFANSNAGHLLMSAFMGVDADKYGAVRAFGNKSK